MYEVCGKCLHSKSCHTPDGINMLYCSACQKLCDKDEYDLEHKFSKVLIQDGMRFEIK